MCQRAQDRAWEPASDGSCHFLVSRIPQRQTQTLHFLHDSTPKTALPSTGHTWQSATNLLMCPWASPSPSVASVSPPVTRGYWVWIISKIRCCFDVRMCQASQGHPCNHHSFKPRLMPAAGKSWSCKAKAPRRQPLLLQSWCFAEPDGGNGTGEATGCDTRRGCGPEVKTLNSRPGSPSHRRRAGCSSLRTPAPNAGSCSASRCPQRPLCQQR